MTKQIYEIFKNNLNEDISEINEEGVKYIIYSYQGNHFCSLKVETKIEVDINPDDINKLNKEEYSLYKYAFKDKKLSISTSLWTDNKPTKQSFTEMIALLISSLKSAKVLLENIND